MLKEFKEFLTKSNAMALAIGVIIGAASGKVVSALVADILMPIISLIIPGGDWREASFVIGHAKDKAGNPTDVLMKYGDFAGNIVDFIVIALVVFLITKAVMKPAPAPPSQTCPYCKESNAVDATKCKACASALTPA